MPLSVSLQAYAGLEQWRPRFWSRRPPQRLGPRLIGSHRAELVVVGGGLTGLSVAFHAKERNSGWRVLLVEAAQIAAGSSGMAGGIVVKNESVPNSLEDAEYLYHLIDRLRLRCDLLASDGRLAGVANEYANDLLNPFLLTQGLATACVQLGVELYEASPALSIETHQADIIVAGRHFVARSRFVVLAIDAFAGMWNGLFGSEFETTSQVCLVARLQGEEVSRIPWVYYSPTGGEDEYVWGRRIGDRRFLFGSKEGPREHFDSSYKTEVVQDFRARLPELHKAVPESAWSGLISRFRDTGGRVRQVLDERIIFGGGYDGYGIPAAVATGAEIAKTIFASVRSLII